MKKKRSMKALRAILKSKRVFDSQPESSSDDSFDEEKWGRGNYIICWQKNGLFTSPYKSVSLLSV
jgi:hypothetical protein